MSFTSVAEYEAVCKEHKKLKKRNLELELKITQLTTVLQSVKILAAQGNEPRAPVEDRGSSLLFSSSAHKSRGLKEFSSSKSHLEKFSFSMGRFGTQLGLHAFQKYVYPPNLRVIPTKDRGTKILVCRAPDGSPVLLDMSGRAQFTVNWQTTDVSQFKQPVLVPTTAPFQRVYRGVYYYNDGVAKGNARQCVYTVEPVGYLLQEFPGDQYVMASSNAYRTLHWIDLRKYTGHTRADLLDFIIAETQHQTDAAAGDISIPQSTRTLWKDAQRLSPLKWERDFTGQKLVDIQNGYMIQAIESHMANQGTAATNMLGQQESTAQSADAVGSALYLPVTDMVPWLVQKTGKSFPRELGSLTSAVQELVDRTEALDQISLGNGETVAARDTRRTNTAATADLSWQAVKGFVRGGDAPGRSKDQMPGFFKEWQVDLGDCYDFGDAGTMAALASLAAALALSVYATGTALGNRQTYSEHSSIRSPESINLKN